MFGMSDVGMRTYLSKLQLELLKCSQKEIFGFFYLKLLKSVKFSHHSEIQLDSILLQLGAVLLNTHGLFRPDQIMIFLFLFISVFVSICGLKQCITFSQQSFQA